MEDKIIEALEAKGFEVIKTNAWYTIEDGGRFYYVGSENDAPETVVLNAMCAICGISL